jgi:hypothetical protein
MTATYVALATVTLTGNDSEILFSSIPGTYRDLVLVMNAATTSNANNRMRFNGDSGTNYALIFMWGDGGGTATDAFSLSWAAIDWSAFTTTTVGATNHIVQIMDYSANNKHKLTLNRGNRAQGLVETLTNRWANNDPITSISITGGTFVAGSTFSLYGIN